MLAVVSPVFNVLIEIVLDSISAFAVVSAGNIGSCVSVKTPYILKLSKLFKYNKSFTFSDALGTTILVDWVLIPIVFNEDFIPLTVLLNELNESFVV